MSDYYLFCKQTKSWYLKVLSKFKRESKINILIQEKAILNYFFQYKWMF